MSVPTHFHDDAKRTLSCRTTHARVPFLTRSAHPIRPSHLHHLRVYAPHLNADATTYVRSRRRHTPPTTNGACAPQVPNPSHETCHIHGLCHAAASLSLFSDSDLQKSVGCCPIRMPSVTNRIGVQCPTRLCMCHSVYPRWPSRTKSLQGCSVPVLKRPGTKLCMSTAGVTCRQWLERSLVRNGMN